MDNEINHTGTHTIMVRKGAEGKNVYWSTYSFEGHDIKMNQPEKGQWVRLPFNELCKIVNLGTESYTSIVTGKRQQFLAVYLVQVPG